MTREELERQVAEAADVLGATVRTGQPHAHLPKVCKWCQGPIYWVQVDGRSRPVDAQPSAAGSIRLFDRGGTIVGITIRDEARQKYEGALRTPHVKTCAYAGEWGKASDPQ